MILLKDGMMQEIFDFFDQCELHGQSIPGISLFDILASIDVDLTARAASALPKRSESAKQKSVSFDANTNTVAYEARYLKV